MPKGSYERTPEVRRAQSERMRGKRASEETKQRMSEVRRGKKNGHEAAGVKVTARGYRVLTGQYDHPLADGYGALHEHRQVLYDRIGPGPHECHWNRVSGCGRTELNWGGRGGIVADHLNGELSDNRQENLVPSCHACNNRRRFAGNPVDWDGQYERRWPL